MSWHKNIRAGGSGEHEKTRDDDSRGFRQISLSFLEIIAFRIERNEIFPPLPASPLIVRLDSRKTRKLFLLLSRERVFNACAMFLFILFLFLFFFFRSLYP